MFLVFWSRCATFNHRVMYIVEGRRRNKKQQQLLKRSKGKYSIPFSARVCLEQFSSPNLTHARLLSGANLRLMLSWRRLLWGDLRTREWRSQIATTTTTEQVTNVDSLLLIPQENENLCPCKRTKCAVSPAYLGGRKRALGLLVCLRHEWVQLNAGSGQQQEERFCSVSVSMQKSHTSSKQPKCVREFLKI